jgi:hypothetical protein
VNDEMERIWKDAAVAKFHIYFLDLPGAIEENLSHYTGSTVRDFNLGLPDDEGGGSPTVT